MEQTARKLQQIAPVVQYDLAALQLKLFALTSIVTDLENRIARQAEEIQKLQERTEWLGK